MNKVADRILVLMAIADARVDGDICMNPGKVIVVGNENTILRMCKSNMFAIVRTD